MSSGTCLKNKKFQGATVMLGKIFDANNLAVILIPSFLSAFVTISILLLSPNYFLIFVVVLVPFFSIFIFNKPFVLLQIIVFIMPFTGMEVFNVQIMGVPGLKLINVIVFVTLFSFIIAKHIPTIDVNEKIFIIGLLSILLIAVMRSVPHIQIINQEMDENFGYVRFFQSLFFKSIIYLSPFVFITLYVSSFEKIQLIIKTYLFSILSFSLFLLAFYIFFIPDKTNIASVRESLLNATHLHGNALGGIFVISFPLMLSYFYVKKNLFSIFVLTLCVVGIGISYSRTAYALLVLSIFMHLYLSKRFSLAPVVGGFLIALIYILPSSISERALTGIEEKDITVISAGRVGEIWLPLAKEVLESPEKLIFGLGIRGIFLTDGYRNNNIYISAQAHNLYLDTILDIGLLGLTFFALFYIKFIKNIFKCIKRNTCSTNENEILIGVVVSTLNFLIGGITGKQIFPTLNNYPLWLMLAFGSAILKFQAKKETD